MFGAIAVGVTPLLLLTIELVRSESERIWRLSSVTFGAMIIGAASRHMP
ncbi:MAG: hypothetical protein J2P13_09510 [Acidobacteria bacterium]|nr:hypothetical protein [Acidobacteriota bacterium]